MVELGSVFALSMCVFSYQVMLAPTVSTLFAGHSLHLVLAPSWLAFALAFSLLSFFPKSRVRAWADSRTGILACACLTTLAVPLTFLALRGLQESMYAELMANRDARGVAILESYLAYAARAALVAAVPFFFYGLFLSSVFARVRDDSRSRLLATEFAGLALGMCAGALLLDLSGSWIATVGASAMAGVGAIASLRPKGRAALVAGGGSLLALFTVPFAEPNVPANLVARDFTFSQVVKEEARSWTTFSKVQLLDIQGMGERSFHRRVIALGDGTGHARLHTPSDVPLLRTVAPALALEPKSAVVLFAGAGADLMSFAAHSRTKMRLVGVELNPALVAHAKSEKPGLEDFLAAGSGDLEISEARLYLERSRETFDSVLFSFAGATIAHLSGAIMHTTQYTLTREALQTAWRHLNPGGVMTIFPGSKLNLIASLKTLEKNGKISALAESAIVLGLTYDLNWKRVWEDHVLMVKKGAFTREDVDRVAAAVRDSGYIVAVSPFTETHAEFQWHKKLIESADAPAVLADLQKDTGLRFDDFGDDRPFVYKNTERPRYESFGYWRWLFGAFSLKGVFSRRHDFALFVAVLALVALIVTARRLGSLGPAGAVLGIASTAAHVVLTYRCLFYFGNPTRALILSTVIWFGGGTLAALAHAHASVRRRFLCLPMMAASLVIWPLLSGSASGFLFEFGFVTRALIVTAATLPVSFGVGLIFPLLLRSARGELALPLLAIDALGSAFAVVSAPLMAEDMGLSATISIAAVACAIASVLAVLAILKRAPKAAV